MNWWRFTELFAMLVVGTVLGALGRFMGVGFFLLIALAMCVFFALLDAPRGFKFKSKGVDHEPS